MPRKINTILDLTQFPYLLTTEIRKNLREKNRFFFLILKN